MNFFNFNKEQLFVCLKSGFSLVDNIQVKFSRVSVKMKKLVHLERAAGESCESKPRPKFSLTSAIRCMTIEILCEAAGLSVLFLSLSALVTHMSRHFGRKNGKICILLGRKRQTNKLRRAQVDCAPGGLCALLTCEKARRLICIMRVVYIRFFRRKCCLQLVSRRRRRSRAAAKTPFAHFMQLFSSLCCTAGRLKICDMETKGPWWEPDTHTKSPLKASLLSLQAEKSRFSSSRRKTFYFIWIIIATAEQRKSERYSSSNGLFQTHLRAAHGGAQKGRFVDAREMPFYNAQ
jgi:hypothetical protein